MNEVGHPLPRRALAVAAVLYTAFVVYGSLVPLRLQYLPLADAWHRFSQISYLQLGVDSRADWVANLLLFVPLAFLWLGAAWPHGGAWRRVVAGIGTGLVLVSLAVCIEFVQVYFPQRTVSINDIVAEALGACVGIGIWSCTGPRLVEWAKGWGRAQGLADGWGRVLALYLAGVFLYAVMPLDLTLSPVEIFHKWKEGKVVTVPFSARYPGTAERLYDLASDAAIWAVAAGLWRRASARPRADIWRRVVLAAAAVETAQLFVYSRVSDPTDIVMAAIGSAAALTLDPGRPTVASAPARRRARPVGIFALLWCALVLGVFWYPFDFRGDPSFVAERLQGVRRVPFEAYYFGSEFRALTEVLHKTLYMLPLGLLLAHLLPTPPAGRSAAAHVCAALVLTLPPALVECGQIFLPSKNADPTDFALGWIGAVVGYIGASWLQALARTSARRDAAVRTSRP